MCQSISVVSVTQPRCAKTAERIEVLFGLETLEDPRHIVLDGGLGRPAGSENGRGPIVKYININFPSHLLNSSTLIASSTKLLWSLVLPTATCYRTN